MTSIFGSCHLCWLRIVDPQEDQVTVLVLQDNIYVEHGVFKMGDEATSVLLTGLRIDVRAMLNA